MLRAFEGNRGFDNARDGKVLRGDGGEGELVEFAFAMREGGGSINHHLSQRLIDHVDDEFAGSSDVSRGVFRRFTIFVSRGEGDDGRVGAEDVEEGKGGGIDASLLIDCRDPGDRSGRNQGREEVVSLRWWELVHFVNHSRLKG